MATERITDPVLGAGEIFFGGSEGAWVTFETDFAPTKSHVLVLASVVDGRVPQVERDLFRALEAWYPEGVHDVHAGIRREVENDQVLRKWLPPDLIPDRLQLMKMNIRIPSSEPAACVLTYRFDPDKPVWHVRLGEDFRVEWCGLGD